MAAVLFPHQVATLKRDRAKTQLARNSQLNVCQPTFSQS